MMRDFYADVMAIVRRAVDDVYGGNVAKASREWGISNDNLNKWLNGKRTPTLEKLSPILNRIGLQAVAANLDSGQDVKFVRPIAVSSDSRPLDSSDYIAAPLVGEVGAGPGYIPQDVIKSWFLVYKHQDAVRYRRNLIAVEIGPTSTSMRPTLNPKDIVLVDRDDKDVSRPGRMMLVMDPDGEGMIKRVSVQEGRREDFLIFFYSDNAAEYPPVVYSLNRDYAGEWEKAVVGRVVWAWSDVREK